MPKNRHSWHHKVLFDNHYCRNFGDLETFAKALSLPARLEGTEMGQLAKRMYSFLAIAAAMLLVSGCGGGVEFKGGIFDVLGVNDINTRKEPKLASRPGLVVPPSTASLPAPGSAPQTTVGANGEAFPVNPEDAKKRDKAIVLARHKAFCEKSRQRFEARITKEIVDSPWGSCQESILRNLTGRDLSGKAVGER